MCRWERCKDSIVGDDDDDDRGKRGDIDEEDDQESYFRYMEENPMAGVVVDDDDDIEYDEDGNAIIPEKKVTLVITVSSRSKLLSTNMCWL